MKGALSLACLVFVLGTCSGAWIGKPEEETRLCRSVCNKCGCQGFSCGEECLCECREKQFGDKYMACITNARNISPMNTMDYDIVVQGPNGNDRISRSVLTKEVNPEEVFPSEHFFNFAHPEDEDVAAPHDENVEAPVATQSNVNRGWDVIKTLRIAPLAANTGNNGKPLFRALDHQNVLDDLHKRFDSHKLANLPSPSFSHNVPAPKAVAAPVVAPVVASKTLPGVGAGQLPSFGKPGFPDHSGHFKQFHELLTKPLEIRSQLTVKE